MTYVKDGAMIILSSPSGAGKTTLVKKISKLDNFSISISHTTREPRSNENEGEDYFFTSQEDFKKLINENKFLEYAKVFDNYYGSSKEVVLNKLKNSQNVIFDIDWQGTQQIKNINLKHKLLTIFILPPSKEELFKRLLNRESTSKKIALDRMKQFEDDLKHWVDYDFVVINDNLEKCYQEIIKFITMKLENQKFNMLNKDLIENHVKNLLI